MTTDRIAQLEQQQRMMLLEQRVAELTRERGTLQAQLAVVVQVLEQIRDLELDRPMTWEGPTAQWQHQQLATAQVMAAKTLNNHPAAARALLDELARVKAELKERDEIIMDTHKRAEQAQTHTTALREALEFYAKREHWMGLTSDSPSRRLLVANGRNHQTGDGWEEAQAALRQGEGKK